MSKVQENLNRLKQLVNSQVTVSPQAITGFKKRIENMTIEERQALNQEWTRLQTTGSMTEEQKYRAAFPAIQEYLDEAYRKVVA
jgi:hypothetical protein